MKPGDPAAEITLGVHTYLLVEQPHARVLRQVPKALGTLELGADTTIEGLVRALGDRVYRVLQVFIPELMGEWEFDGYPSPSAWEAVRAHVREVADLRTAHERLVSEALEQGNEPPEFVEPPFEDPYDPEADRSPTFPQLVTAVKRAGEVNSFDIVRHLVSFLGADFLRQEMQQALMDWRDSARLTPSESGPEPPSSPATSGTSPPTSSGTSDQTPAPAEDSASPSPASTDS